MGDPFHGQLAAVKTRYPLDFQKLLERGQKLEAPLLGLAKSIYYAVGSTDLDQIQWLKSTEYG